MAVGPVRIVAVLIAAAGVLLLITAVAATSEGWWRATVTPIPSAAVGNAISVVNSVTGLRSVSIGPVQRCATSIVVNISVTRCWSNSDAAIDEDIVASGASTAACSGDRTAMRHRFRTVMAMAILSSITGFVGACVVLALDHQRVVGFAAACIFVLASAESMIAVGMLVQTINGTLYCGSDFCAWLAASGAAFASCETTFGQAGTVCAVAGALCFLVAAFASVIVAYRPKDDSPLVAVLPPTASSAVDLPASASPPQTSSPALVTSSSRTRNECDTDSDMRTAQSHDSSRVASPVTSDVALTPRAPW